jgi:hypothetical protein
MHPVACRSGRFGRVGSSALATSAGARMSGWQAVRRREMWRWPSLTLAFSRCLPGSCSPQCGEARARTPLARRASRSAARARNERRLRVGIPSGRQIARAARPLVLAGVGWTPHDERMTLTLRSPAFEPGTAIPARFDHGRGDLSPALIWDGVPEGEVPAEAAAGATASACPGYLGPAQPPGD